MKLIFLPRRHFFGFWGPFGKHSAEKVTRSGRIQYILKFTLQSILDAKGTFGNALGRTTVEGKNIQLYLLKTLDYSEDLNFRAIFADV